MTAPGRRRLAAAARGWHVFPLRPAPRHRGSPTTPRTPAASTTHGAATATPAGNPARPPTPTGSAAPGAAGPTGSGSPPGRPAWSSSTWTYPSPTNSCRRVAAARRRRRARRPCRPRRPGREPLPLDTYTVATPSGGTHLYYRHPAGPQLRNTTGSLGWKVHTRAHGGYVAAAGTRLPNGRYPVARDADPDHCPPGSPSGSHPYPSHPNNPSASTSPTARPVPRGCDQPSARPHRCRRPGGRNTALYRSAVALGQLAAGGAIDTEDIATC